MKTLVALLVLAPAIYSQPHTASLTTCNGGRQITTHRYRFCELRDQTITAGGRLTLEPGKSGAVVVKGWSRNEVFIRGRIEAEAASLEGAKGRAELVRVEANANQIEAIGPEDDSWWSVSYEIFAPERTDLTITSFNGDIDLSEVSGHIEFQARNGSVRLTHVGGNVRGEANGEIEINLAGDTWEGEALDVRTNNQPITVMVPENYSAHVQAENVRGRFISDLRGGRRLQSIGPRRIMDFETGSGGPLLRVTTTNGDVKLLRKI